MDETPSENTEQEEQSVASLVYDTFRPHVTNPKHVAYLFPEGYKESKAETMEEKRERRRKQIFNRRDSLRVSNTKSEGSGFVRANSFRIRRMGSNKSTKSVASNHSNDSAPNTPTAKQRPASVHLGDIKHPAEADFSRARSASVPTLAVDDNVDLPSRLHMRRSTNAYLEVMWPRFFGSNRDSKDSVSLSSQNSLDDFPGSMGAVVEEPDVFDFPRKSGDASEDDVNSIEEEVYVPVPAILQQAEAPVSHNMRSGSFSKKSPTDVESFVESPLIRRDSGIAISETTFDLDGAITSSTISLENDDPLHLDYEHGHLEPHIPSGTFNRSEQEANISVNVNKLPIPGEAETSKPRLNYSSSIKADKSKRKPKLVHQMAVESNQGANASSKNRKDSNVRRADSGDARYADVMNHLMWEDAGSEASATDQLIPNPWHSRYSDSSFDSLDVPIAAEAYGADVSFDSDDTIPDEFISGVTANMLISSKGTGRRPTKQIVPEQQVQKEDQETEELNKASLTSTYSQVAPVEVSELKLASNDLNSLPSSHEISAQKGHPTFRGIDQCNDETDQGVDNIKRGQQGCGNEKWTLIKSGEFSRESRTKYGSTTQESLPLCHEKKKSIKVEKMKIRKTLKLCCFPFTINW